MAAFAVLFGTRHIDATEHQDGLMLAIATESVIKLVAFLAVGIFVTFVMYPGPLALFAEALQRPQTAAVLTRMPAATMFLATTVLSLFAIVLLPRQFHVGVVENHSEAEVRRAAWLFPVYLVLINLFVMPIAMAGLLAFPAGGTDGDMFVLALPLKAHSELFALVAFVGGLSAATAMVIVESVALAIMVSNDIVIPLILKRRAAGSGEPSNAGAQLLTVRRIAIFAILSLAYVYYRSAGPAQLASIGLLSFAAVTQLDARLFRRARLAARYGARRHRRYDRRLSGLGLYASAAEHLRRGRRRRSSSMTVRSVLPGCGRRRCLVSICRRSFMALFSASSPTLCSMLAAR